MYCSQKDKLLLKMCCRHTSEVLFFSENIESQKSGVPWEKVCLYSKGRFQTNFCQKLVQRGEFQGQFFRQSRDAGKNSFCAVAKMLHMLLKFESMRSGK